MSPVASTTRKARLDFRLSVQQKRMIEQAASVAGQSLSDYAISNLIRQAQQTLDDASATRLSIRDRDLFLHALDAGTAPNKALKTAARRYKKRRA